MPHSASQLIIRPAHPDDAPVLGMIHARGWHFAYQGIISEEYLRNEITPEIMQDKWQRRLPQKDPHIATYIAILNGEPVGFAGAGPGRLVGRQNFGELYAIYVDPAHYGAGIGRALFRQAIEHVKAIEFNKMYVKVLRDNNIARSFYETMGGVPKEEYPDGLVLKDIAYPDVVYEWGSIENKAFV